MGIDYDGGMIVGCHGKEIEVPEDYDGDFYEWCEENDLDIMHLYFDSDKNNSYIGFGILDVPMKNLTIEWVFEIKKLGEKFKELTGVDAFLIGTQNIW